MSLNLLPIVIFIVLLMIIAVIVKTILMKRPQEPQIYPYEKQLDFFSPTERSFFGVLEQAVSGRYRLMGKVRLADVVKVKGGMNKSSWQSAFNRIQSKHLDIVACDPSTLRIQFVVELDDSTHTQSKRQTRDQFIDSVLQAARIPFVHVTAKKGYSVQDIRGILSQVGAVTKD